MAEDFAQLLASRAEAIERQLEALLAREAQRGEIARPPRLIAAMRHAALDGGKRLRPFLLMETARLFGQEGDGVLRAACALELVHCYSLVHDDLPAMDDDDLRRGRPTVHKAFDEATAILAGDALLTLAFDVMGDAPTHTDAAVRAELVVGLARSAGVGGMAGGQMFDLEAETADSALDRPAIERLQAMKTGALLHFAVDAGAIMGRAPGEKRQALGRYGRALGGAFQVADDILDAEGDAVQLGKRAGKDAERQKATLVALLGLAEARRIRDELAAQAETALGAFDGGADVLRAAARFAVHRTY
jgi:farnesyl diphosphate synthase